MRCRVPVPDEPKHCHRRIMTRRCAPGASPSAALYVASSGGQQASSLSHISWQTSVAHQSSDHTSGSSCDNFLYEEPQGRADARRGQAAAGLTREPSRRPHRASAGRPRPPDRRTAYGPPPLVKPTAPSARECRTPMAWAQDNGETMTTRATPSAGNDGGTAHAGGVGKSRALPGGSPTGAASRRLAAVPLPVGRWWAAVTRRPAPASRGKQRLTGRGHAVRVQQWTAKAGPHGSQAGHQKGGGRRRPKWGCRR